MTREKTNKMELESGFRLYRIFILIGFILNGIHFVFLGFARLYLFIFLNTDRPYIAKVPYAAYPILVTNVIGFIGTVLIVIGFVQWRNYYSEKETKSNLLFLLIFFSVLSVTYHIVNIIQSLAIAGIIPIGIGGGIPLLIIIVGSYVMLSLAFTEFNKFSKYIGTREDTYKPTLVLYFPTVIASSLIGLLWIIFYFTFEFTQNVDVAIGIFYAFLFIWGLGSLMIGAGFIELCLKIMNINYHEPKAEAITAAK